MEWLVSATYATTAWPTKWLPCVSACPEGAIAVEIVDVDEWRRNYVSANAPGLPSADDSISTTRVTLPENLPPDTGRVDAQRIMPEHPHWPLVFMLVLSQLSVGAFGALAALSNLNHGPNYWTSLISALALAGFSLGTATLHLGRPAYAWRALKGLRRSWLSREVLGLSLFAGTATFYTGSALLHLPLQLAAGGSTVFFGLAGVLCSARIYMVPARPAWFSRYTVAEFFSTALLLGPLLVWALDFRALGLADRTLLVRAVLTGAGVQLLTQLLKFLWLSQSEQFELRASALLLSGRLRDAFLVRLGVLVLGGIVLPLLVSTATGALATLMLALIGEWLGRWLFFVSVVPKNIAAAFTAPGRVAV